MHCVSLYLRIPPRKISLLRFLLEGHDGLAMLSTLDSSLGIVRLLVTESRYNELFRFLAGTSHELARTHSCVTLTK